MNALIELLNLWGTRCLHSALPMLLQASLLIVVLLLLDLTFESHARAVVRYGLWLLVLVKLVLPPSLALPTGIGYWLDARKQGSVERTLPATTVLRFSEAISLEGEPKLSPPPAAPALGFAAYGLLAWIAGSLVLLGILICRSRNVARRVAEAAEAPAQLQELLNGCCRQMGVRQGIALKLAGFAMSPAACGLLRPVILIPEELVDKLSMPSLRSVLLHELAHIKRGDVWVNYLQTLLQIVYWYHPLLWLANAQIRRVREQAVDEMVMVEMGEDAETYPATLLQVAKACFTRAKLSLGLVGIVESGSALAQRLKRLVNRPIPTTSRLTVANVLLCLLVGAALLPMAHGQRNDKKLSSDITTKAVLPADRLVPKSVWPLTITITKDGRFYLGTELVSIEKLKQELEAAVGRNPRAVLSLRADRDTSIDTIVKVADAAKAANIARVVLAGTNTVENGATIDEELPGAINLGEEYRRNIPFIFHSLDRNFLDYFGERGVEEIDKALKVLNDLPPMSSQALGINEIKIIKLREDIARLQAQSRSAVSFEIKLLSLPPSAIPQLALGMPISTNEQGHVTWKQTAAELSNLLRSLKQRDDIQTLLTPRVTTLSGRQAKVETSDIQLAPDLKLGTAIDLVPYLKGDQIDLTVNAAFTWSGSIDQLYNQRVDANAGAVFSINAVGYVTYEASTRVTLENDQSAIISYPTKNLRGQTFLIVVSAKVTLILDATTAPAPTNPP